MAIAARIEELRKMRGVSVNNFLGRRYSSGFENALRRYREWGDVSAFTGEGYIAYYAQPSTGTILAAHYSQSADSKKPICSIEYAFLGSDGHVLPDPECCGRITIKKVESLGECLRILHREFSFM